MARRSAIATLEKETILRELWDDAQNAALSLNDALKAFRKASKSPGGLQAISVSTAGNSSTFDVTKAKEYPGLASEFTNDYRLAKYLRGNSASEDDLVEEMVNIMYCAVDQRVIYQLR